MKIFNRSISIRFHLTYSIGALIFAFMVSLATLSASPKQELIEAISVSTFALAFFLGLFTYRKMDSTNRNGLMFLVLVILFFAFLEESEFFTELGFIGYSAPWKYQPEFMKPWLAGIGKEDRYFRSFHNLINDIFTQWYPANRNPELFRQLKTYTMQTFLVTAVLVLSLHASNRELGKNGKLPLFSIAILGLGSFATLNLLQIPTFPNNSFIGPYSALRIFLVSSVLILSLLPMITHFNWMPRIEKLRAKFSQDFIRESKVDLWRGYYLLLLAIFLFTSQLWLSSSLNLLSFAVSQRIMPIFSFAAGAAVIACVCTLSNAKILFGPVRLVRPKLAKFFSENPSFIYLVLLAPTILLSQSKEWGFFDSPNLEFILAWFKTWAVEESLEFYGAILCIFAALFISRSRNKFI